MKQTAISLPQPKESQIQATIKSYLQWKGWFVFKIQQGALSYKGIADLCAVKNGRTVWIEVKTATGKQHQCQIQFQQDVENHGGEYMVARSIDDVMILEG